MHGIHSNMINNKQGTLQIRLSRVHMCVVEPKKVEAVGEEEAFANRISNGNKAHVSRQIESVKAFKVERQVKAVRRDDCGGLAVSRHSIA